MLDISSSFVIPIVIKRFMDGRLCGFNHLVKYHAAT